MHNQNGITLELLFFFFFKILIVRKDNWDEILSHVIDKWVKRKSSAKKKKRKVDKK